MDQPGKSLNPFGFLKPLVSLLPLAGLVLQQGWG